MMRWLSRVEQLRLDRARKSGMIEYMFRQKILWMISFPARAIRVWSVFSSVAFVIDKGLAEG